MERSHEGYWIYTPVGNTGHGLTNCWIRQLHLLGTASSTLDESRSASEQCRHFWLAAALVPPPASFSRWDRADRGRGWWRKNKWVKNAEDSGGWTVIMTAWRRPVHHDDGLTDCRRVKWRGGLHQPAALSSGSCWKSRWLPARDPDALEIEKKRINIINNNLPPVVFIFLWKRIVT